MNEYNDIIGEQKQEELRTSLYAGVRQQPDTEAKIQSLATRVGLPVDAVRRNQPEVELHDRLNSFDYEKVIKESPKLSSWLADPKNAAVAHDDWERLSGLEKLVTHGRDYAGAVGQGVIGQGLGTTLSGAGELYGVATRSLENALSFVLPQPAMEALRTPIPWYLAPEQILKRPGKELKKAGEFIAPPKERQTLGTDVASGIGQLGFQISAYLATGGLASTGMLLSQGADIMAEKTAKDIADPALRDTAIVAGSAITALTERYGLDKILNRVPPEIKNRTLRFIADKVAAGGIEAAQELTEGLLHDITRRITTNENAELLQGIEREMSAAALSAAIVRSALGIRGHRQAKQNEEFFKALGEETSQSKLRERLPERYRELVDKYTEGGAVQQVLVPADKFTEYFQSQNIDPAQMASQVGASNYLEALASGSDVVIPMAGFVADIAPTDHLQGLMQDLRLSPEELTMRESKLAEANRDQGDQALQEEIGKINEAAKASEGLDVAIQRIVSDVEGQLVQRYDVQTARNMATTMRGVAVLAQRANPDADPLQAAQDLWAKYGLTVAPMAQQEQAADGVEFNQTIETPEFKKWFGDSKVVDENGKPLVVYHGTVSDFDAFSQKFQGAVTRATSSKSGFFFTASPRTAQSYADHGALVAPVERLVAEADKAGDRGNWDLYDEKINAAEQLEAELSDPANRGRGQNLVPVYLNLQNPLVLDAKGETPAGIGGIDPLIQKAKRAGHDGVVIKNFDDAAGLANDNADHYIVFNPTQIKSAIGNRGTFDPNDPSILNQGKRGSIQIGADRRMKISLFEDANLSTFLHESGHFYLEVIGDLAEQEGTSQQVKDDYAKLLKFLGVKSRAEIQVKHHEKWARANEAYLMEGKAPSPELRGVFQRFSAWLSMIYKQLKALDVNLTDEVRGVMDRIYATDAEIERAKQEAGIQSLFVDAKTAGMTEEEFALYRESISEQTTEAKEELQQKLMRIEKLKREKWWKDERAKVAEEVAAEYDAMPVAQAFDRMSAKDSTERLNKSQLTERYGEDILKRLPRGYTDGRGAIYAGDGNDIDSQAEVMGFASADDMIQALTNLPNRARFIAAESDARMMERHGDVLNSIAIADEATAALHNAQREKVIRMELRALGRLAKTVKPFVKAEKDKAKAQRREAVSATQMPPASTFRNIARGIVGQKQVRDLTPHSYLLAERKASKLAFEAMAKGDVAEAQVQKQRELFNHYLYLESRNAKQEADKIAKSLKAFESDKKRMEIAKAGADYLEQIDLLLERYEFKKVSLRSIERRESLSAWLQRQEAEGNAVAVPIEVQDESRLINWQQVPMDELRALHDSVKNIAHLASLKNKLIRKRKAIDFDKVVKELLESAQASGLESTGDLGRPSMKGASLKTKGASAWRKFDASHLKVEQIVEWLDGGKINGPWARYFFDLADDAQTQEYDLHAMVTTKIEELSKAMPKSWRHNIFDKTTLKLPGFDEPITRHALISIALNMGNAQNQQRLMDGYGWSETDLQAVKDSLTEQDMQFVQGTWDAIELLWPHMAQLEERMSGLPPEKVEAVEIEVAGKKYRGGYFPLVYDPKKSQAGEKQTNEIESVQNFVAQGYGRAATNRGATKQRLENFSAPVMLDYEQVVTSHLAKVIKDISHREAVLGINKILTQNEIKAELIDKLGEARYEDLRKWLQMLVSDRADTLHQASGLAGVVMKTRTNTAIVTMGWKISTMMAQFAGFGPSMDTVKPSFLTKALIHSTLNPRDAWAFVSSKSGEMRNRANTIERDAKDALIRMRGEGGVAADVRRTAFFFTAMADRVVSIPTWRGAYDQALAEGKTEEDAIRAGDRAVRLSQGAGGSKDLAAVQRNNELMKLLTMYYTPFNVLYARLRDVGHQTSVQGIGYLPKAAARLLALVVLPAVMGDLLAGRGPGEDEDETWWSIRKILLYPLATIPVLRDFSGYMEAGIIKASGEGEMKFAPSYKLSPVVGALEKIARLPGKAADVATGEKEFDEVAWDIFETSGYVFGLPTAQPRITGEYLLNLLSGNEDPENAAELMRDAVFRKQK